MSKVRLSGGRRCFTSSVGHNNFYYPSDKSVNILYDTDAERVSWIGGGDRLIPVIISSNSINKERPSEERTVVWIEKN